jgi:serine/threonine protein kinase
MDQTSKFLGAGTFGCAFYPSLPSDDPNPEEDTNSVTKLVTETEAQKEMDSSRIFKIVDPYGDIGLYPYKIVKLKPIQSQELREQMAMCKVRGKFGPLYHPLENVYSPDSVGLLLPKGEMDLHKYLRLIEVNRDNTLTVLSSYLQLCMGVLKLHENGIYHFDIKDNNIIVTTTMGLEFKLIDFSTSTTLKSLEALVASRVTPVFCSADYTIYPFYNNLSFSRNKKLASKVEDMDKSLTLVDQLVSLYKVNYLRPFYNPVAVEAITNNPRAPPLVAWMAENTDSFSLALTLIGLFPYLTLSPIMIEDFYRLVFSHILNKCSTKGFVARLNAWIQNSVTEDLRLKDLEVNHLDYQLAYKEDPDQGAPPVKIFERSLASKAAVTRIFRTIVEDGLHPYYFFNAIHLYDAYTSIEEGGDAKLVTAAALMLTLDPIFHRSITQKLNLDIATVKLEMLKIKEAFNGIPSGIGVSGPTTVSYWLSILSDFESSPLSWNKKLTSLTAYMYSNFTNVNVVIRYSVYLLNKYYPEEVDTSNVFPEDPEELRIMKESTAIYTKEIVDIAVRAKTAVTIFKRSELP